MNDSPLQLARLRLVLPAIFGLVTLGIITILSLEVARPESKDNVLIVGQVLSILSPVILGLLVLLKVEEVDSKVDAQHKEVNSRMDELLKRAEEAGFARGLAAGEKK